MVLLLSSSLLFLTEEEDGETRWKGRVKTIRTPRPRLVSKEKKRRGDVAAPPKRGRGRKRKDACICAHARCVLACTLTYT